MARVSCADPSKCLPLERPIEPRDIELLIRLAISRGWQPKSPGQPFLLELEQGALDMNLAVDGMDRGCKTVRRL
jgi:uncharacterized LabA/DUF88 family protein